MNHIEKRVFLLITLLCSLTSLSLAQTGSIKGTIKDNNTNNIITGATVQIVGTPQGVATNTEGYFEISHIEPGKYTLQVSFLSYQDLIVEDVIVEADKIIDLSLELVHSDGELVEEVVISATRLRNTNQAVLSEIRSARQVVSGISQQQIRMSQDRDAAQVMSRIPGLTIVDNRFVMVRGIPERYNQVMLNNAIAPSTEVDKRTFSFDLIPSGVLERMMIYKSGSPENPGDFAGGLIKVYTNSATGENFTTFSVGSNYRSNTTFSPYIYSRISGADFLGFDGGERALPSAFPSSHELLNLPSNSPTLHEAPKMLNNDLSYQSQNAIPDLNFGVGLGRSWDILGHKRLSMLTSLNYSQSNQYFSRNFNRYLIQDPSDYGTPADWSFTYVDNRYEKENRVGLLTNWSLILDPFNKIEFKNLFNQIGENITFLRSGYDIMIQGRERRNYMYEYRSRSIYSGQLEGTHRFDAGKTSLKWVFGSNFLRENQPDLRRFRTTQESEGSSVYRLEAPPGSSFYDTGRYFGRLAEIGVNNSVNLERQMGGTTENPILLKAGYLVDYRDRDFSARYFSYSPANLLNVEDITTLPLDQVFANESFGPTLFKVQEGTNERDSYTGSNLLTAGFVGVMIPRGNFTFEGGFRAEYNILKLNSFHSGGTPVNVNNKLLSPLGFLNIDYSLGALQKLRLAYGRSVNRPEFRELAPFLFYDFEMDTNREGNPDLKTATIDNFDFRYEIYPRMGETISVGTFYKRFSNPIEMVAMLQGGGSSPAFTLTNAHRAYSYGAELEIRKSFRGLTESLFLDRFSINMNASIIKSEVDYGSNINEEIQDVTRPLQGQSPFIVNAVLNYLDEGKGWNISAAYNVIGNRIFVIGNADFPTIYELPRHAVDLTISKSLGRSLALKVGVQDLLNAPFRFYQDTNRDEKIDMVNDDMIFRYNRGTLFTTSLTYTLK